MGEGGWEGTQENRSWMEPGETGEIGTHSLLKQQILQRPAAVHPQ